MQTLLNVNDINYYKELLFNYSFNPFKSGDRFMKKLLYNIQMLNQHRNFRTQISHLLSM